MDELRAKVNAFEVLQKLLDKSLPDEDKAVADKVLRHQVGKLLVKVGEMGLGVAIWPGKRATLVKVLRNKDAFLMQLFANGINVLNEINKGLAAFLGKHGIDGIYMYGDGILFVSECLDCAYKIPLKPHKETVFSAEQLIKIGKDLMEVSDADRN